MKATSDEFYPILYLVNSCHRLDAVVAMSLLRIWWSAIVLWIVDWAISHPTLSFSISNLTVPSINQTNAAVFQFEDIVTRRLADFTSWEQVTVVSASLRSSEQDITVRQSNRVLIEAFIPYISSLFRIQSYEGDPIRWEPTQTEKLPRGVLPPRAFIWELRDALALSQALTVLQQKGYKGPWTAATLGRSPVDILPDYRGTVYTFEREPRMFRKAFVYMAAASGEIIGSHNGDDVGDGIQGGSRNESAYVNPELEPIVLSRATA